MALEAIMARPPMAIIERKFDSGYTVEPSGLITIFSDAVPQYPDAELVREQMRQTIEGGYMAAANDIYQACDKVEHTLEKQVKAVGESMEIQRKHREIDYRRIARITGKQIVKDF